MEKARVSAIVSVSPHRLFEGYEPLWRAVAPELHPKSYAREEVIAHHGDAASRLWLVFRGWVKLTRQTPDGKETIVGLCSEGDMFGEAALFAHASYPYHAQVVGADAELASIPATTMRALVAKDPSFSSHLMATLNDRMAQAQLKLEHLSTMSAAQRLGCFLLRQCHTQAVGKKTLQVPVDKHILASYLGMKPETLSRSQQQLKPYGVEVSGQSFTVTDISKLREFVCESCSESGACEAED